MNHEDRVRRNYDEQPEYTAQQVGSVEDGVARLIAGLSPEALEGLEMFREMVDEHVELLEERREAIALIDCQNPEETFIGALRNLLQVKVSAVDNNEKLWGLCNAIAVLIGAPRSLGGEPMWSSHSLVQTVAALATRDREYTQFQASVAELLDVKPDESIASAVQRLKARQPKVVSIDGFRLQKEFRAAIKETSERIASGVPLEPGEAGEYALALKIIHSATKDAA